ncbi:MAG TPA: hypothetical protein VLV16_12385 [Gemmatimonadales bacterium]|nr:hypothetical protein [Gemmatimonadales bacterium]
MTRADLLALLVVATASGLGAQRPPVRTIAVGDTVADTLRKRDHLLPRDSTYAREWEIAGRRDAVVTVDLVSDSFDAYLIVYGPGLAQGGLQDDDSGGHCNARITVRFPESGAYHIAVTTADKHQTGPFVLAVTSGAKAPSLERCRRTR